MPKSEFFSSLSLSVTVSKKEKIIKMGCFYMRLDTDFTQTLAARAWQLEFEPGAGRAGLRG